MDENYFSHHFKRFTEIALQKTTTMILLKFTHTLSVNLYNQTRLILIYTSSTLKDCIVISSLYAINIKTCTLMCCQRRNMCSYNQNVRSLSLFLCSYGLLSIKWTKKVLTLSHFFLPRDSIRATWRPPHKGTDLK